MKETTSNMAPRCPFPDYPHSGPQVYYNGSQAGLADAGQGKPIFQTLWSCG